VDQGGFDGRDWIHRRIHQPIHLHDHASRIPLAALITGMSRAITTLTRT
jgi:hypothetical protein